MIVRLFAVLFPLVLISACASNTTTTDMAFGSEGATYKNAANEEIVYGSMQDFAEQTDDIVYFAFDSSSLSESALLILKKQASWLNAYPKTTITIEGNCDERGTREYNLALGERRANAVKDYLISQGVAPSRISVISYGKERPAVIGSSEEAWALNRRAVSVVQ